MERWETAVGQALQKLCDAVTRLEDAALGAPGGYVGELNQAADWAMRAHDKANAALKQYRRAVALMKLPQAPHVAGEGPQL